MHLSKIAQPEIKNGAGLVSICSEVTGSYAPGWCKLASKGAEEFEAQPGPLALEVA